jgi:hypothetical protein
MSASSRCGHRNTETRNTLNVRTINALSPMRGIAIAVLIENLPYEPTVVTAGQCLATIQ